MRKSCNARYSADLWLKFMAFVSDPIPMPNVTRTVWVEWNDGNHGTDILTFESRLGGNVLNSDKAKFHTFQAYVAVIRGITEVR